MHRVLLIENEDVARDAALRVLRSLGHEVVAVDGSEAMVHLDDGRFDVVIVAGAPERESANVAKPEPLPQALLHLPRPFSAEKLAGAISALDARESLRSAFEDARLENARGPRPIVGRSATMQRVLDKVDAIADSDAPVLLTGESGTGKDLLARAVHAKSARRTAAFVAVNCAAFPETLLEAELFGHERGAFTGALQRRDGRFKAADGGTLFLDEVNGLSMAAQAKLLRVLQDGSFQPIGTNTTHSVNVRLVSATNRDLKTLVAEGAFREDLYYRIKVLDIEVPPLRARHGDVPLLSQFFIAKHGAPDREPPNVSPAAWAALAHHGYPGNVRELEHAIMHALVLSRGGDIQIEHLPRDICPRPRESERGGEIRSLADAMHEFEREYMLRVLHEASGNKTHAARLLGISRKSLWEKLTKGSETRDTSATRQNERYER